MNNVLILLCFVTLAWAFHGNALKLDDEKPKIVGGVPINITDAPHQVVVQLGGSLICGGSILSPTFVVTAGHCIIRTTVYFSVRAGTSDHVLGGTVHKAVNVTVHPKYDDILYDYDIALLEVDPPIEFDDTKQLISISDDEPSAGNVTITGWGTLTENGEIPRILQSVTVPFVTEDDCNVLLEEYGGISARMFCAGDTGHDSCQGDSGGPVLQNGLLTGLVSWGNGCARKGYPGVNTKLANPQVRDFVRQVAGV